MIKIHPAPGYILAQPYIQKDSLFQSVKEVSGESQKSEVLAIGEDLVDDNGNIRKPNCKIGDRIIHCYLSEDFNVGTEKFRFVHFSNIRGIMEVKDESK
jgi:co-chaperonin GroES (HSP10)